MATRQTPRKTPPKTGRRAAGTSGGAPAVKASTKAATKPATKPPVKPSAKPSAKAATKAAAAKSAAANAAPTKTRPAAAATGPLSLAQARAIVAAQAPAPRSAERALALSPDTTAADVGAARRRRSLSHRRVVQQRSRDYAATMALLKRHGVKGLPTEPPAPAARPRGSRGKARDTLAPAGGTGSTGPLQVLAEGDSWFDYPVPLFGGGVIPRLEKRLGLPILNLAKAGDETRFMLGVAQRLKLADLLRSGSPAGGAWDVLLFSGGGNDIVDNPLALWLKDYDPALSPAEQLHGPRFAAALTLVRAAYEDLIALRDAHSPGTHLVFHCYDFALPDGRGICNMGPWLKPAFDLRGFPDQASAWAVVREMLGQFAAMLAKLGRQSGVTVVNAQGTLAPVKAAWHNELHPAKDGFNQMADIFASTLRTLFPTRVPV